jgi:hypothetical protein
MLVEHEDIRHDGGTYRVEVEIDGDQCVIRFGASFTLRVDETNLNTLREMLHDAACDMQCENPYSFTDHEMIQHGIDAREQRKAMAAEDYDPNDPANW